MLFDYKAGLSGVSRRGSGVNIDDLEWSWKAVPKWPSLRMLVPSDLQQPKSAW